MSKKSAVCLLSEKANVSARPTTKSVFEADIFLAMSSNTDDRTLHELYVYPFMNALRENVGSVMCSYERANNSYGCQNSKLLNGVLKTELGFSGFVMSDWEAQHSGVASANAGLDLVMPDGGFWGGNLTQAVNNGSVSIDRLNDMVTRQLASFFYVGQGTGYPAAAVHSNLQLQEPVNVQGDHSDLIREIGAAGTVLVKNVNDTLPLKNPRFLSVYGYDATIKAGPWQNPTRYGGGYEVNFGWNTFNGTMITGGGSGGSTPPYVVAPFQAIQERIAKDKGTLRWDFYSENPTPPYVNTDACLVFINAYASESFDRTTLTDDFSDNLVKNVAANCSNTIVIIHSAGIRVVDEWIDHANVTAVLFAGLPGQESGHWLTDILYGDVSPSGRLPYTVARKEEDYGSLLNATISFDPYSQSNFSEGVALITATSISTTSSLASSSASDCPTLLSTTPSCIQLNSPMETYLPIPTQTSPLSLVATHSSGTRSSQSPSKSLILVMCLLMKSLRSMWVFLMRRRSS